MGCTDGLTGEESEVGVCAALDIGMEVAAGTCAAAGTHAVSMTNVINKKADFFKTFFVNIIFSPF